LNSFINKDIFFGAWTDPDCSPSTIQIYREEGLAHHLTQSLQNERGETQGRWRKARARKGGGGEEGGVVGVVIDAYRLFLVGWRRVLLLLLALIYIFVSWFERGGERGM
jgi:hypothetical protein